MDNVNLKVKIYLENENDKFMGIGVLWLLQKVKSTGSLRAGALELGISYSKAYKMVENLESALGKEVLERRKGGMNRNGASLTPFGETFISLYDEFQRKCKVRLEEPFEDFCGKLDSLLKEEG